MNLEWRKSSYTGTNDDEICVELAQAPFGVAVRDSKNPAKGQLSLTARQFTRLAQAVKR